MVITKQGMRLTHTSYIGCSTGSLVLPLRYTSTSVYLIGNTSIVRGGDSMSLLQVVVLVMQVAWPWLLAAGVVMTLVAATEK